MRKNIISHLLICILSFAFLCSLSSCDKKRLSYVDIVKREKKAIKAFMAKHDFQLGKAPEKGQTSPDKLFFEPVEGVYMRILKTGDLGDMAVNAKTVVLCRMKLVRFTKEKQQIVDNISADQAANYNPAQFIFNENDRLIQSAPNTRYSKFNDFLAPAMQTALKYVGNHGEVEMIVSFKRGPLDNLIQRDGEPVYYERVSFNFKK